MNLFFMALSMVAALFGIQVATSSKRNAEEEEAKASGAPPGRKASMADKYLHKPGMYALFVFCEIRGTSR